MSVMSADNNGVSGTSATVHESGLKESDLNEFFLAYDSEFNKEDLHDRVLIFDVLKEERQTNLERNNAVWRTEHALKDKLEPSDNTEIQILPASHVEKKVVSEPAKNVKVSARKRAADQQLLKNTKKPRSETDRDDGNANVVQDGVISKYGNSVIFNSELDMLEKMAECEIVREHKVFVHATFLAIHSQYFRALFYSGMSESSSKEVHIKIQESDEQTHLKMLEAIYRPYILDNMSLEELLQILELSDKYDLTYVFRKCKYLLLKMKLSVDDCENIMNFIEIKQKMPLTSDLATNVREFLLIEFSLLDKTWESEKFINLSETLLRVLLSSEDLMALSENTVFHALMYWIINTGYNYRLIPSKTEPPSLLTLVKFELLTIDYLYNVVQDHHIAREMPAFSELYLKGITYHALPMDMRETIVGRELLDVAYVHKWEITKDKIESVKDLPTLATETTNESESRLDPSTVLESPRFWWCGYQMQMKMSDIRNLGSQSGYLLAMLHLHVHGLKKRSKLPVKWFVHCAEFRPMKSTETLCTFSFDNNTSSQNFKIRNRVENNSYVIPHLISISVRIRHLPSNKANITGNDE